MIFNVLARNVDDHSKNVSFCMSRKGDWWLSPAYDVTFSVDMAAPSYVNRQSLSVNGKYESITRKDLETVAKNNDILEYNALIDTVVSALSKFKQHAKRLDINEILIQQIANELINV